MHRSRVVPCGSSQRSLLHSGFLKSVGVCPYIVTAVGTCGGNPVIGLIWVIFDALVTMAFLNYKLKSETTVDPQLM